MPQNIILEEISGSLTMEEENPDWNIMNFLMSFDSNWLQSALKWTQYIL